MTTRKIDPYPPRAGLDDEVAFRRFMNQVRAYVNSAFGFIELGTDSGVIDAQNYTSVTIAGGTGIDTSASGATVTVRTHDAEINHNALLNYKSKEHIDWTNASDAFQTSGNVYLSAAGILTVPSFPNPALGTENQFIVSYPDTTYGIAPKLDFDATEYTIPAMKTSDMTTTDGHAIVYDAANTKFKMAAVSGGSGAPTTASYVTLGTDATLTNERVLTAGGGIATVDAGAGSTITVKLTELVNSQTAGYTIVAGDLGKLIKYTGAGGVTLAVTAAATLGAGFFCYVRNDSSGNITVDPNASETVNGSTTYVLGPGGTIRLMCDGSNFFTQHDSLGTLTSNGLVAQTSAGVFAARTLTGPAAGITVTNGAGTAGNPTLALANDLSALEGLAGTGIAVRSAADTWVQRTLTAPAAGITVSNGDGVSGNPTLALANDLSAVEGLASTGIAARTAADTWTTRTITAPAAGITVSNGDGVSGNPTLALANDLSALEGLGSTGLAARTAADTWAQRTITGTSNEVSVSNGDGVSGNPTLSLPSTLALRTKTVQVQDNNFTISDDLDSTKLVAFQASGLTTGTTRTLTVQDTSGTLYVSGGTDVPVADGGTGVSSLTAYAVMCGGTTSTSPVQSVASLGTSGWVLTSNGAGALPTFQAASGSGQSAIQFQDEGVNIGSSGAITTVNFTGAGVTASNATTTITVNVPGTATFDYGMSYAYASGNFW
jgi:hypothetical protein